MAAQPLASILALAVRDLWRRFRRQDDHPADKGRYSESKPTSLHGLAGHRGDRSRHSVECAASGLARSDGRQQSLEVENTGKVAEPGVLQPEAEQHR
jgi:hypothetical protein